MKYKSLADNLAQKIHSGDLPPGAKLPTHRALADQYDVALATATKAYQHLTGLGLIAGETGRGMYVRDLSLSVSDAFEQHHNQGITDFVINMPGDRSDAGLLRSGLKTLASGGDLEAMLRYQAHAGREHEIKMIAKYLSATLGHIPPQCLYITSGAQHSLAVTVLGCLNSGDVIATDELTYPGFKSVCELKGIHMVPVKTTDGVMCPKDLHRACLKHRPNAVYLMPTVQNPLGYVMDEAVRLEILRIVKKFNLLIIEDGAYAFLNTNSPKTFLQLAPKRTIYCGSFSKCLATGIRSGYIVADSKYKAKITQAIKATIWNAPSLISGLISIWIADGTLQKVMTKRRQMGKKQQSLAKNILKNFHTQSHQNANFIWIWLNENQRSQPVIKELALHGIAVSDARPFAVGKSVPAALRLAFGGIEINTLKSRLQIVRDVLTDKI